jgi:hypothetical protein
MIHSFGCHAQDLCDTIKRAATGQHVAFVCNHRVSIERGCLDQIIRAEFNPDALVRGVQETLEETATRIAASKYAPIRGTGVSQP